MPIHTKEEFAEYVRCLQQDVYLKTGFRIKLSTLRESFANSLGFKGSNGLLGRLANEPVEFTNRDFFVKLSAHLGQLIEGGDYVLSLKDFPYPKDANLSRLEKHRILYCALEFSEETELMYRGNNTDLCHSLGLPCRTTSFKQDLQNDSVYYDSLVMSFWPNGGGTWASNCTTGRYFLKTAFGVGNVRFIDDDSAFNKSKFLKALLYSNLHIKNAGLNGKYLKVEMNRLATYLGSYEFVFKGSRKPFQINSQNICMTFRELLKLDIVTKHTDVPFQAFVLEHFMYLLKCSLSDAVHDFENNLKDQEDHKSLHAGIDAWAWNELIDRSKWVCEFDKKHGLFEPAFFNEAAVQLVSSNLISLIDDDCVLDTPIVDCLTNSISETHSYFNYDHLWRRGRFDEESIVNGFEIATTPYDSNNLVYRPGNVEDPLYNMDRHILNHGKPNSWMVSWESTRGTTAYGTIIESKTVQFPDDDIGYIEGQEFYTSELNKQRLNADDFINRIELALGKPSGGSYFHTHPVRDIQQKTILVLRNFQYWDLGDFIKGLKAVVDSQQIEAIVIDEVFLKAAFPAYPFKSFDRDGFVSCREYDALISALNENFTVSSFRANVGTSSFQYLSEQLIYF